MRIFANGVWLSWWMRLLILAWNIALLGTWLYVREQAPVVSLPNPCVNGICNV